MGIDLHALHFLNYTKSKMLLGDTITIGRQGLDVAETTVKELIKTKSDYKNQPYCEDLLKEYFGASNVESIDNSTYEKASHIHNMNEPIPGNLAGKFDTVVDGGCLEHIFNIPQALRNCSLFCKPGGQILHILPANNFCGHGFWQFSPELFFSLYSKENGYDETEVFLADLSDPETWYKVHQPRDGKRVNVMSASALYVLVRTVLRAADFKHLNVQQSDYVYVWDGLKNNKSEPVLPKKRGFVADLLKGVPFVYNALAPVYHSYLQSKASDGLNSRNPGLLQIDVRKFVYSL
jgi:SAM-dependent methyltransferase